MIRDDEFVEYELRVPADKKPWNGMAGIERDFWGAVMCQRLLATSPDYGRATVRVVPFAGIGPTRLFRVTPNTERLVSEAPDGVWP